MRNLISLRGPISRGPRRRRPDGACTSPCARTAVAALCFHAAWLAAAESASGTACSAALEEAAEVHTGGCAGFEAFQVDDGPLLLAVANFWDGRSHDMGAKSKVYRVSGSRDLGERVSLSLELSQAFSTKGAHGWDFFETAHGDKLLVVPNYYGCGSTRGPTPEDAPCRSTVVYRWQTGIKKGRDSRGHFESLQTLATSGPGQTDHFHRQNETYLIVGENFANQVAVYRWLRGAFTRVQTLPCQGAGATAVTNIKGEIWLVATSYHGGPAGWRTESPVYVWEEGATGFVQAGAIAGQGVHDAEMIEFGGRHYLFLSEDRDDTSSSVSSQVLVFAEANRSWVTIQKLPTDGAHGAELFVALGSLWLAIANFGDRLGERYEAESTLRRFQPEAAGGDDVGRGGGGVGGQFVLAASVTTQGATDWEHFVVGGVDFLAVANEGDVRNRMHQTSYVYRLVERCASDTKVEL